MVRPKALPHGNRQPRDWNDVPAVRLRDAARWAGAAIVLLFGGALVIVIAPFGVLAQHMAAHILFMSLVSPALALSLLALAPRGVGVFASGRSSSLALAASGQVVLLWAWHAPAVLQAASHLSALHVLMHASLLAGALWFWLEVFSDRGALRWRALFALLMTGKLVCLLGVLLVFAPRSLYASDASAHGHALVGPVGALADQQLAGLLMLIACPLTYVLAGVVIAAHWLRELSEAPARQLAPVSAGSFQS
jgi:putative membrane protein